MLITELLFLFVLLRWKQGSIFIFILYFYLVLMYYLTELLVIDSLNTNQTKPLHLAPLH